MRAGSFCLALIEDDDVIRFHNCVHIVNDNHDSVSLHSLSNSAINSGVALVIQTGSCLIHQKVVGIRHQGSGNGNPLSLSTGEQLAVRTDVGVVAFWQ